MVKELVVNQYTERNNAWVYSHACTWHIFLEFIGILKYAITIVLLLNFHVYCSASVGQT